MIQIQVNIKTRTLQAPVARYVPLPSGGNTDYVLAKKSPANFDYYWKPDAGGNANSDVISKIAAVTLSGHRVVFSADNSHADYADSADYSKCARILGLTLSAAVSGEAVNVQQAGIVIEPSWSWVTGNDIYLTSNGNISQTAPTSNNLMQIGTALSATSMQLNINFICTLS